MRSERYDVIDVDQSEEISRRQLLVGTAGCVGTTLIPLPEARAEPDDEAIKLIKRLTGRTPTPSTRVHLAMPTTFPNGYTVPLSLEIDSHMTPADYVEYVRVVAPKNPLVEVATFYFTPGRSQPRVSTRIRLSEPQTVLALAAMNNGALLMAKAWVSVASDGCK